MKSKRFCFWFLFFLVLAAIGVYVWHEHHQSAGMREAHAAAGVLAREVVATTLELAANAGTLTLDEKRHWEEELQRDPVASVGDGVLFLRAFRNEVGKCIYFLNVQGGPAASGPDGKPAPPPCDPWIGPVDAALGELRALDDYLKQGDLCPEDAKEELARRCRNIGRLLYPGPPGPGWAYK